MVRKAGIFQFGNVHCAIIVDNNRFRFIFATSAAGNPLLASLRALHTAEMGHQQALCQCYIKVTDERTIAVPL